MMIITNKNTTPTPFRSLTTVVMMVASMMLVEAADARLVAGVPASISQSQATNEKRDLFVVCDPSACERCNQETEVALTSTGCCPVCHGVSELDCTKCPEGYNNIEADGTTCSTCTCSEGGVETCGTPTTDVSAECFVPQCKPFGAVSASFGVEPTIMTCANCTTASYFDGCNTCLCSGADDMGLGACTRMECSVYDEAYCIDDDTDRSAGAAGGTVSDGLVVDCATCGNQPYFNGCNFCWCREEADNTTTKLCLAKNTCTTEEEAEPYCIDCVTCGSGVFHDGFRTCMCEDDGDIICGEYSDEEFSEPYCW